MSNTDTTDPTLPKPSSLIDRPWFWKVVQTALVAGVAALAWTGKTTWDAQARIEAIKADVLKSANEKTTEQLAGYLQTEKFLQWRIQFEQEERARDREKLADLKALLEAQRR